MAFEREIRRLSFLDQIKLLVMRLVYGLRMKNERLLHAANGNRKFKRP